MKTLDQFMWGYQEHFQFGIEALARRVLNLIGFQGQADVLLVGLARPENDTQHPVCVCPEDGRWRQDVFATLPEAAERARMEHPDQHLFYGDEPSMRDKPESIRRRAISDEVSRHLRADDERHGVRSFCSNAVPYGDYYVVTVVQLPTAHLSLHPTIRYRSFDGDAETNLVLNCIREVLGQAEQELLRPWPEPGRGLNDRMRLDDSEIVARSAHSMMRIPFIPGDWGSPGLFGAIEEVAKLLYEQESSRGTFILASAEDPNVDYVFRLKNSVPLRHSRWIRKLCQMATGRAALIAGYDMVHGLGTISDMSADPFVIDIVGPHQWDLKCGGQVYLRVRQGVAKLPQEDIAASRFDDNAKRLFQSISDPAVARMRNVLSLLLQLRRGSMIVFAEDAALEAERLEGQGTRIQPTAISLELIERETAIDGTILADPRGVCHAIGVILDGTASTGCTPARGSRYNSAVRYVGTGTIGRMALVISDDATLDVVPLLEPRIDRQEIEKAVAKIEQATLDSYLQARNYLSAHRFYIDTGQCARINAALDRIESEPTDVGRIVFKTPRFEVDPGMDASYFLPDDRR